MLDAATPPPRAGGFIPRVPAGSLFDMTLAPVEFMRQGRAAEAPHQDRVTGWTVWPARERPALAVVVAAVLVMLALAAAMAWGDPLLGVLSSLAVAVSLQGFLLPTDYVLGPEGITVHEPLRVRRVLWSDVHGVMWRGDRGFLRASRDSAGRLLPRWGGPRGLTILLGADAVAAAARREAVEASLRRHGT